MAEEEVKRSVPILPPNRAQAAESGRQIHLITAESSENPEDFLQPEFWAHVARNFNPMDHVELRTDDCQYWAEYLVIAADRTWAKVHLLREVKLAAHEPMPENKRYLVAWKGPHRKWCVIRRQDSSLLHEGEQEKAGAVRWMDDYERTVGRAAA